MHHVRKLRHHAYQQGSLQYWGLTPITPAARLAEFFGLCTFAVRMAAIIGPITYGLVTWLTDNNHRLAILATGSFFVIGLMLLRRVDMRRGTALGLQAAKTR